jgi:hypothetical protein
MLSAIIAAEESERTLVPTLACLVAGMTAGLVREVIVADAGVNEVIAEVADIAGCRLIRAPGPLGARLNSAASSARAQWLLFLRAGTILESCWVGEAMRFMAEREPLPGGPAAIFRPAAPGRMRTVIEEFFALARLLAHRVNRESHALLIARSFYRALGGHPDASNPEAALLGKLGSRRTIVLRGVAPSHQPAIA